MKRSYQLFVILVGALAFFLLSGFGLFGHKKYDTPITKETLQPDKVLFDRASLGRYATDASIYQIETELIPVS